MRRYYADQSRFRQWLRRRVQVYSTGLTQKPKLAFRVLMSRQLTDEADFFNYLGTTAEFEGWDISDREGGSVLKVNMLDVGWCKDLRDFNRGQTLKDQTTGSWSAVVRTCRHWPETGKEMGRVRIIAAPTYWTWRIRPGARYHWDPQRSGRAIISVGWSSPGGIMAVIISSIYFLIVFCLFLAQWPQQPKKKPSPEASDYDNDMILQAGSTNQPNWTRRLGLKFLLKLFKYVC